MTDLQDIVRRHTEASAPPLCPEIRLHLITPRCALWRATEADLGSLGLPEPWWGFAWPGGQALARWVLDHPAEVRGRSGIDVGAGGGIEAIAAAKAGAGSVVAFDVDPLAAEAVRLNAALNGVEVDAVARDPVGTDEGWDLVLAGDVLYGRDLAERMGPWLEALARRGAAVLVGEPGRGFWNAGKARLLAEYDAPADVDPDGRMRRATGVYRLG